MPDTTVNDPSKDPRLEQDARSAIEAEIGTEVSPLQSLVGQYGREEQRSMGALSELFGGVQAGAEASAGRVRDYSNATQDMERALFNSATQQMNRIREQRAAEAQALSQELGAPVPVSLFTSTNDLNRQLFSAESAGKLLQSSALGQAEVGRAEAFAGRVFPLMKVAETKATKNYYRDKITQIQEQIASIKRTKGARVNERLRELQAQEREWELNKVRADRDWQVAQTTLANEKKRLALEERDLKRREAETEGWVWDPKTKTYKPTLERDRLNAQKQIEKAQLKTAQKRLIQENRDYAFKLLNAAMTGGVEEMDRYMPIETSRDKMDYKGKDGKYYRWVTQKVKVQTTRALSNPNEVFDYLVGNGVSRARATEAVSTRFPGWKGKGAHPEGDAESLSKMGPQQNLTRNELSQFTFTKLVTIAKKRGWTPGMGGKKWNKDMLINYILDSNPIGSRPK